MLPLTSTVNAEVLGETKPWLVYAAAALSGLAATLIVLLLFRIVTPARLARREQHAS
jgi:hypothetical protein